MQVFTAFIDPTTEEIVELFSNFFEAREYALTHSNVWEEEVMAESEAEARLRVENVMYNDPIQLYEVEDVPAHFYL